MLTETQLRSALKRNLHNDDTFTDPSDLRLYLTLGQRRIVRDAPWVLGAKQVATDITTVADTQAYSLASDFYQLRGIWNTTSGWQLRPMNQREWTEYVEAATTVSTGAPQWYRIQSYDATNSVWKIRFYLTPDDAYTIKYFYYWMPADVAEDTPGPIASLGFDELVIWAATMICREVNDIEGAMSAQAHYYRLLEEYKAYEPQKPDQMLFLRSQADYGGGGATAKLPPEYPG